MRTGLILGKFMPPHQGHLLCIEMAKRLVDRLTVLVCSLPDEPIPGERRFAWLRERFPDCEVRWLNEVVPSEPSQHPDFWSIWKATIRRFVPTGPDYIFASDDYGATLADLLGAQWVPVDRDRVLMPISGTAIRNAPLTHWEHLPEFVRPYYLRRVCIFGPESTGKTTLARQLAAHYRTQWVPEFARGWIDANPRDLAPDDFPFIAQGQIALEDALARQANRVLFCDTDPLTTTLWAMEFLGRIPDPVSQLAAERRYDLTLLLQVDVPWVADSQRFLPHARREFFQKCEQALQQAGRAYVTITGDWAERWQQACAAIDALLART
ncbi:AAA family ATPase [Tuwongella immobilis]